MGVLMLPTDPMAETLERARRIEQLGYDHLWTYDHLSWRRYRGRPWFASTPWLTAVAGVTDRIRLGAMVTSPNFRNPVALAQEAVTLDHVSDGRLILGVGAGGIGFDATVFGGDALRPPELVARLGEFVDILGRLFAEPTVSYRGAYYTLDEAVVAPAAVQTPRVPIAVAAAGPKALELAARRGDAWITFSNGDDAAMGCACAQARGCVRGDRARSVDDSPDQPPRRDRRTPTRRRRRVRRLHRPLRGTRLHRSRVPPPTRRRPGLERSRIGRRRHRDRRVAPLAFVGARSTFAVRPTPEEAGAQPVATAAVRQLGDDLARGGAEVVRAAGRPDRAGHRRLDARGCSGPSRGASTSSGADHARRVNVRSAPMM